MPCGVLPLAGGPVPGPALTPACLSGSETLRIRRVKGQEAGSCSPRRRGLSSTRLGGGDVVLGPRLSPLWTDAVLLTSFLLPFMPQSACPWDVVICHPQEKRKAGRSGWESRGGEEGVRLREADRSRRARWPVGGGRGGVSAEAVSSRCLMRVCVFAGRGPLLPHAVHGAGPAVPTEAF